MRVVYGRVFLCGNSTHLLIDLQNNWFKIIAATLF